MALFLLVLAHAGRMLLSGSRSCSCDSEIPVVDLLTATAVDRGLRQRIEQVQAREGGFAMIHGAPGSGKSIALRVLAERLARLADVTVGAINHPQNNLADFYRELGDVFGVPLHPHDRWGGFKALRQLWQAHLESTRRRPVLLFDEAQEMAPPILSELRLMTSARFNSQPLLCVVLAGDARLPEKLRHEDLMPLGSRIRARLATEYANREELLACWQGPITPA